MLKKKKETQNSLSVAKNVSNGKFLCMRLTKICLVAVIDYVELICWSNGLR